MSGIVFRSATIVEAGQQTEVDLRVDAAGRIASIGSGVAARRGDREIDASGCWLLPGLIDDQVHFREPGLETKGDIATESRAAVAGGTTSFMDMPNTRPPTLDRAALEDKFARARGSSHANYAFHFGASNDNLDNVRSVDPATVPGVKVFMGASTGNMLVDDPKILEGIFRDCPVPVITHCEDTPTIDANLARAIAKYGDDIPAEEHPHIRSREACLKSSTLAVGLARQFDARLHVLHISTADELALFEPGPVEGKRITAETCVHYLHFDARDYGRLGHLIKCNPAIKSPADREAILQALVERRIDILATDHAPHELDLKLGPYVSAPSGLPLVQFALPLALERVHAGDLTIERLVEAYCHAPAALFGVVERGHLCEGWHADLVLVRQDAPHAITRSDVLSKCGWSPFEGETFRSRVEMTLVNGVVAYERAAGGVQPVVAGQQLAFGGDRR